MSIDDLLPIYEEAIKLGKARGKKEGEDLSVEFFEILKKQNKEDKIKHLGQTDKDIDLLTGDMREEGYKILNLTEEERRKIKWKTLKSAFIAVKRLFIKDKY